MTDESVHLGRSIDLDIAIDAPLEAVWKALTEADELIRWFPVYARVEPGAGGRIMVAWSEGGEWESSIEIWEPNRHLRLIDRASSGEPTEGVQPVPVAIDYHLRSEGGRTIVRLVHSGFAASSDWDEYLDALEGGWTYFLMNLKHYLERHPGVPRDLVFERRRVSVPRDRFWRQVLGPEGLDVQPDSCELQPGEPYACALGSGTVHLVRAPVHFAGTVSDLSDALLFVELEMGGESWHCGIWLSTYGLPPDRVTQLRSQLSSLADGLFEVPLVNS